MNRNTAIPKDGISIAYRLLQIVSPLLAGENEYKHGFRLDECSYNHRNSKIHNSRATEIHLGSETGGQTKSLISLN